MIGTYSLIEVQSNRKWAPDEWCCCTSAKV